MSDHPQPLRAGFAKHLRAIADALGIPIETFYQDAGAEAGLEALALLRTWAAIEGAGGRERVMNLARREAGQPEA